MNRYEAELHSILQFVSAFLCRFGHDDSPAVDFTELLINIQKLQMNHQHRSVLGPERKKQTMFRGISFLWVGAAPVFLDVGQAIIIRVQIPVRGIVRVPAVAGFLFIGHTDLYQGLVNFNIII